MTSKVQGERPFAVWKVVLAAGCGYLLEVPFPGWGRCAGIGFAVATAAITEHPRVRTRKRFWAILSAILIIHVLAFYWAREPLNRAPAALAVPLAIGEAIVVFLVIAYTVGDEDYHEVT